MALYIAFISQYIIWLILPAIIGLGLQIYIVYIQDFSSVAVLPFAVIMSLWSVFFLEFWQRKEKCISYISMNSI